ncbi:MAG: cytochrome b/b6 domain-containing protein [Burkholderiaceae bacterium]
MDSVANSAGMAQTVKVWDPFVRVFHWSLVASFLGAYLLGDESAAWHQNLGYAALGLVAARILWGFVGSRYARFSSFVPSAPKLANYVKDVLARREARSLGHNPLGGVMILALLLAVATIGTTGWMMSLDSFFGIEWVEDLHKSVANLTLALVGLHVAGVIFSSVRHQENLVKAMITGRKQK